MAESHKEVTIKGRSFRVGRFSARDGSFIALKVAGWLGPMFEGVGVAQKPEDVKLFGLVGKLTANLTEAEFAHIQGKCLAVCEEQLKAGWTKIVNADSSFAVFDLEEDTALVLALTAHALLFNLSDFFGGNGLTDLFSAILPSKPSG